MDARKSNVVFGTHCKCAPANGGIDRFIRLRKERVNGGELFGYTMLGALEGGLTGIFMGQANSNYDIGIFTTSRINSAIISFPGLTYTTLDLITLGKISNIGGFKTYLSNQTPKYPIAINMVTVLNQLGNLILGQ